MRRRRIIANEIYKSIKNDYEINNSFSISSLAKKLQWKTIKKYLHSIKGSSNNIYYFILIFKIHINNFLSNALDEKKIG